MNTYDRIFGAGPRGVILSVALLSVAYYYEITVGLGDIFIIDSIRFAFIIALITFGLILLIWSLKSLPPTKRGKSLVITGAFKYFRHPLYASFLLFFNMGFACLLNDWIYVVWAIGMLPIWSLNVKSEETLMRREFGEEYVVYCNNTWRFVPRLQIKT
jgi:protein-S-isoprenylcysteine O-methyltransferase Ste14